MAVAVVSSPSFSSLCSWGKSPPSYLGCEALHIGLEHPTAHAQYGACSPPEQHMLACSFQPRCSIPHRILASSCSHKTLNPYLVHPTSHSSLYTSWRLILLRERLQIFVFSKGTSLLVTPPDGGACFVVPFTLKALNLLLDHSISWCRHPAV